MTEESILGYKKVDVPDPNEMANKQKSISDMAMDWAPKILDYSRKAIGLAKGVVSGGYKLAQVGSELVIQGVEDLYDYYFGDNDGDIELVPEEPDPEDLVEQVMEAEAAEWVVLEREEEAGKQA